MRVCVLVGVVIYIQCLVDERDCSPVPPPSPITHHSTQGAWNESGRGLTIWDTFSHTKGKVAGNENGDEACDHYHLCVVASLRVVCVDI